MKTFICLVLCALVAATYAAPARMSLQDRAEIEDFFDLIKKVAPHAFGGLGGGAEVQDDDDDDDAPAKIEALLSQSLQDRAEMESFWDILKKVGKVALGALGDRGQEQEVNQAEAQFWGSVLEVLDNMFGGKKK